MLSCTNDILITLEKCQFKVINLKSKTFENIIIAPLISDENLGYVIASAISPCQQYICVSDDFKRFILYKKVEHEWILLRKCILDRRCSNIKFSHDMNHILTADKSGYLLRFPLEFDDITMNNEENRLKYVIMGHVSVLIDFDLHPKQKLIATADRDEKIRVSHYPDCQEIYTFLLGHDQYVTQVVFSADGSLIYSTAADGYVIFWDLCKKKEIYRHRYSSEKDLIKIPVVTRMFIVNDRIFLFFKNESYAQIITINKLDGIISTISENINLDISTIDVACIKNENECHFFIMSKNDSVYFLKQFFFEHSKGVLCNQPNWVDEIDFSGVSMFERSKFLDTLAKIPVDKTGVDIYYENKEKRLKLKDNGILSDCDDDN